MIGRGRELRRGRRVSHDTLYSSPDPDYSPGLGKVLVHEEGVFWNTRSKVAISYSYEQSSSSTAVTSPEPMKGLAQWSDEEDEDSGYASSATVSSVRMDRVSVNMADNGNDDLKILSYDDKEIVLAGLKDEIWLSAGSEVAMT